ncbi:MAG TPA: glycosyltransferase family 4 protein [Stellaceae bacterium]|nr:glycosyltransferase family 4 protein [Stellaceae bacterium]
MPAPTLLHVLPSFAVGGVQVRLARVINALGDRYRHRVVALDGNRSAAALLDPALETRADTMPREKLSLPAALLALRRRILAAAPDLLLTYNWGSIEWALANSIFGLCRHIHFEDGFGPEETDKRLWRRSMLRRFALTRTSTIVVPSRNLEGIAQHEWHLPTSRLRYIPNGIDADAFAAPRDDAPLFARSADEVIIGTVAPLRPEKNVARLVRVFARLDARHPARLAIAGNGAQRGEIEALARGLGLADRVIFLGNVAEPQRALALFDIFALSSNTEQMPMSVLEAMAIGLPVASVDVGDVKAMLAPENRPHVVAKIDEQAFAAALDTLIAAPTLRAGLGALNRAHVRQHYSWETMVDEYDRVFGAR